MKHSCGAGARLNADNPHNDINFLGESQGNARRPKGLGGRSEDCAQGIFCIFVIASLDQEDLDQNGGISLAGSHREAGDPARKAATIRPPVQCMRGTSEVPVGSLQDLWFKRKLLLFFLKIPVTYGS